MNRKASVTPHITFLVVIQLYGYHETSDTGDLAGLLFRGRSFSHSKLGIFFILVFSSAAFYIPALSASPQHSTLHLYEPPEIRQWTIHSLRLWNCSQHAYSQSTFLRQRRSQVKWLTPVKPEKKRLSSECAVSLLSHPVWRRRRRRRRS